MIYGEMWSDYANVLCGLVLKILPFFNVHTKTFANLRKNRQYFKYCAKYTFRNHFTIFHILGIFMSQYDVLLNEMNQGYGMEVPKIKRKAENHLISFAVEKFLKKVPVTSKQCQTEDDSTFHTYMLFHKLAQLAVYVIWKYYTQKIHPFFFKWCSSYSY